MVVLPFPDPDLSSTARGGRGGPLGRAVARPSAPDTGQANATPSTHDPHRLPGPSRTPTAPHPKGVGTIADTHEPSQTPAAFARPRQAPEPTPPPPAPKAWQAQTPTVSVPRFTSKRWTPTFSRLSPSKARTHPSFSTGTRIPNNGPRLALPKKVATADQDRPRKSRGNTAAQPTHHPASRQHASTRGKGTGT